MKNYFVNKCKCGYISNISNKNCPYCNILMEEYNSKLYYDIINETMKKDNIIPPLYKELVIKEDYQQDHRNYHNTLDILIIKKNNIYESCCIAPYASINPRKPIYIINTCNDNKGDIYCYLNNCNIEDFDKDSEYYWYKIPYQSSDMYNNYDKINNLFKNKYNNKLKFNNPLGKEILKEKKINNEKVIKEYLEINYLNYIINNLNIKLYENYYVMINNEEFCNNPNIIKVENGLIKDFKYNSDYIRDNNISTDEDIYNTINNIPDLNSNDIINIQDYNTTDIHNIIGMNNNTKALNIYNMLNELNKKPEMLSIMNVKEDNTDYKDLVLIPYYINEDNEIVYINGNNKSKINGINIFESMEDFNEFINSIYKKNFNEGFILDTIKKEKRDKKINYNKENIPYRFLIEKGNLNHPSSENKKFDKSSYLYSIKGTIYFYIHFYCKANGKNYKNEIKYEYLPYYEDDLTLLIPYSQINNFKNNKYTLFKINKNNNYEKIECNTLENFANKYKIKYEFKKENNIIDTNQVKKLIKKSQKIILEEFNKNMDNEMIKKYSIYYKNVEDDDDFNDDIKSYINGELDDIYIGKIDSNKFSRCYDEDIKKLNYCYTIIFENIEKRLLPEIKIDSDGKNFELYFYFSLNNINENYNLNEDYNEYKTVIYNYKNFDIDRIFKECNSVNDIVKVSLKEDIEDINDKYLYHGSDKKLKILKPNDSGISGKHLFASDSYEFALAYSGKQWNDLEICQGSYNNEFYLLEIFPNMFKDKFDCKGYIYFLNPKDFKYFRKNEYISDKEVKPIKIKEIKNVYEEIKNNNIKLYIYPELPTFIKSREEYIIQKCKEFNIDPNPYLIKLKNTNIKECNSVNDIVEVSLNEDINRTDSMYTFLDEYNLNPELKEYIIKEILPQYNNTIIDKGHDIYHILNVINNSLIICKKLNKNLNMSFVIASYHDIGLLDGDRELHHINSGKRFINDRNMKKFFSMNDLNTMRIAIEEHRASISTKSNIYSMIVSDADRLPLEINNHIIRSWNYNTKHCGPDAKNIDIFNAVYSHLKEKFGSRSARGNQLWTQPAKELAKKDIDYSIKVLNNEKEFKKVLKKLIEDKYITLKNDNSLIL